MMFDFDAYLAKKREQESAAAVKAGQEAQKRGELAQDICTKATVFSGVNNLKTSIRRDGDKIIFQADAFPTLTVRVVAENNFSAEIKTHDFTRSMPGMPKSGSNLDESQITATIADWMIRAG